MEAVPLPHKVLMEPVDKVQWQLQYESDSVTLIFFMVKVNYIYALYMLLPLRIRNGAISNEHI